MSPSNAFETLNLLNLVERAFNLSLNIVWPVVHNVEQSPLSKTMLDLRKNMLNWHKLRGIRAVEHDRNAQLIETLFYHTTSMDGELINKQGHIVGPTLPPQII